MLSDRAKLIVDFYRKYDLKSSCELQDICIALRASITGQSDPYDAEKLSDVINYLKGRLKYWYGAEDEMDLCVKKMCEIAIQMGESELSRRKRNMLTKLLFPQIQSSFVDFNLNQEYLRESGIFPGSLPFALDPERQTQFINYLLTCQSGTYYLSGGYLEDRRDVWAGSYLQPDGSIHLGVDYVVPEGTPVHLPADGLLCYTEPDNGEDCGWGGKAIYHCAGGYVIFGHLMDIQGRPGDLRKKGKEIGRVAPPSKNGGWFPHLHLQIIRKFEHNSDGYGPLTPTIEQDYPNPEEFFWESSRNE